MFIKKWTNARLSDIIDEENKSQKGQKVNKLIARTAAITFAALILITAIVYGCFALVAPRKMSEFYSGAGSGALSLKYAERAYKTDKTEDNLVFTIKRAIAANNNEKTVEYCRILFSDKVGLSADETQFLQNKYCVALYDLDKYSEAIRTAFGFSGGYLSGNALEGLTVNALGKKDSEFLIMILNDLQLMEQNPEIAAENKQRLQKEIELVKKFIKDNPPAE